MIHSECGVAGGDVCVDKVCREGKEVHRENRMICSVQGLCIDLVYFGLLSFSTGVGVFSLFPGLVKAPFYLTIRNRYSQKDKIDLAFSFLGNEKTKHNFLFFFCVLGRKLAALHVHR